MPELDLDAGASRGGTGRAPLRQTVAWCGRRGGGWRFTIALGAGAAGSGIALLATSAWLISRAAQRPSVVALGLAIIGVRFFAVSRASGRYGERLVGHDAALRLLADLRVRVYERLEALAPAGLPGVPERRPAGPSGPGRGRPPGPLLAGHPPLRRGPLVGLPTVGLFWYFLPVRRAVVGLGLLAAGMVVPWLQPVPGPAAGGPAGGGAG